VRVVLVVEGTTSAAAALAAEEEEEEERPWRKKRCCVVVYVPLQRCGAKVTVLRSIWSMIVFWGEIRSVVVGASNKKADPAKKSADVERYPSTTTTSKRRLWEIDRTNYHTTSVFSTTKIII
jgi:hypothetical protein